MKKGFYPKLALDGIRKNKRLYLPYILTCIGMVMIYYIITFLQYSKTIKYLPGADALHSMLSLGGWVIAIFATIFLFYTNSFLMRRRKKEFGLYNILGMNKRNISRILFWEYVIITIISLVSGLVAGIALSKIAELGLVNVVKQKVNYSLSVSGTAIIVTIEVFAAIYLLLFLNGIRQIKFSNAISLMKSDSVGEKPPKGNWFFGIVGLLLLGLAYYITLSIKEPIAALVWFFIAVLLVIAGTYLLFIAGSVLLCRILQKKKKYYYKANHFVSVSSMVYRMKRNGAGLASICILATMVLVMISTTTDLYFGSEDALNKRYTKEINIDMIMEEPDKLTEENITAMRDTITKGNEKYGITPEDVVEYSSVSFVGMMEDNVLSFDGHTINSFDTAVGSNLYQIYMIPLKDYNRMMNTQETLGDKEALVYAYKNDFNADTLAIEGGNTFKIKKHLSAIMNNADSDTSVISSLYVILNDTKDGLVGIKNEENDLGIKPINPTWSYKFNTNLNKEKQMELAKEIRADLRDLTDDSKKTIDHFTCESKEANRDDYYNTFGSLFFLGIVLSIVFIFAAVLIIYYKQISEGYEDQARFEIMQKVGMTKKEIRKSINSQLLTVFFLPLISAGVHLAFAFPIIQKLLLIFELTNVALFAITTVISFLAFALFYTMIYRVTSNAYYKIVSGAKE